jgi:hypothetical protein
LLCFLFMASFFCFCFCFCFCSSSKRRFCSHYSLSFGTRGLECLTILSSP